MYLLYKRFANFGNHISLIKIDLKIVNKNNFHQEIYKSTAMAANNQKKRTICGANHDAGSSEIENLCSSLENRSP